MDDLARSLAREAAQRLWRQVPGQLLRMPVAQPLGEAQESWQGTSLVLCGSTEKGKTAAAVKLAGRLCSDAKNFGGEHADLAARAMWIRADDLTRLGRAENDDDIARLRKAANCPLLFLDDFAEQSKTLNLVLQKRYDRHVPTVMTSGATSIEQLARWLGGTAQLRWILEATRPRGRVVVA